MFKAFKDLKDSKNGGVAVIFALSLLPMAGIAGASVDYASATQVRARLQQAADAAALAGAKMIADTNQKITSESKRIFQVNMPEYKDVYTPVVNIMKNKNTVTVSVAGDMTTSFIGLINIKKLSVNVTSTAETLSEDKMTINIPKSSFLDTEAVDYNRIYVYCFDDKKKNQSDKGRSQMTPLHDNAKTNYNFTIPECKKNETISFYLHNVSCVKDEPALWNPAKTTANYVDKTTATCLDKGTKYGYYTDTTMVNGVYIHNIANNLKILETKLCASLESCKRISNGGILPEGKNRLPNVEKAACTPGSYMYFGWEDQPSEFVVTDMDFDDISYVMECPQKSKSSKPGVVRLIK